MNDRPPPTAGSQRIDLAHTPPFHLGGIEIRPATREVLTPSGVQSLEPRVMQVLAALHAAGGQVLSRDDLIARCWDGVVVGDDAINRAIGKLRRLAEADGGGAFHIDTVPRVGFRLVEDEAHAAPDDAGPPRRFGWRRAVALMLVLGAVAAGAVAWRAWRPASPAADRPAPLIAVLPFDALDDGHESQLLAQAVTVVLRDSLSRMGLRVIVQSASAQFVGTRKADAGHALGVNYVIDGDVQRLGDKLRITVRLDDAQRRITAWSETFDGPSDDANRLALRAANGLGAAIAWPGAREVLARREPLDPQAIALLIESGAADKRGDYAEALEKAHRLVVLAPDMALAQAALGMSTADGMATIAVADRPAALTEGRRAAERALQLDPGLGEAHVAKALLTPNVRWAAREALLQASLRADPDNETGGVFLHVLLTEAGRTEASLPVIQRTLAIDPLSVAAAGREISSLDFTGRSADAERALSAAEQRWPGNPSFQRVRFRMAMLRGDTAAGAAVLAEPGAAAVIEDAGPVQPIHSLLRAIASRRADDVRRAARDCTGPARLSGYQQGTCLQGLALLGDLDDAFRLADTLFPDIRGATPAAVEQAWLAHPNATGYLFLLFHPKLTALRADPRFAALADRMGLARYWRATGHWPDFCASEPASVCSLLRRPPRA